MIYFYRVCAVVTAFSIITKTAYEEAGLDGPDMMLIALLACIYAAIWPLTAPICGAFALGKHLRLQERAREDRERDQARELREAERVIDEDRRRLHD